MAKTLLVFQGNKRQAVLNKKSTAERLRVAGGVAGARELGLVVIDSADPASPQFIGTAEEVTARAMALCGITPVETGVARYFQGSSRVVAGG